MAAFRDRAGEKYGRLTVIEHVGFANGMSTWRCECDCGNRMVVRLSTLQGKGPRSCGCAQYAARQQIGFANKTHGLTHSPEYKSYHSMLQRCENPKCHAFADYGGRGIAVCERWRGEHGFEDFLADMGPRPRGRSLDRINNDLGYSPDNCRWATQKEQINNRRPGKNPEARKIISELLARDPKQSNRQIAKLAGVSHSMVGKIRRGNRSQEQANV